MMDWLKMTPAHTMSTLVVAGAIADGIGIYDPLIKFAGAGDDSNYQFWQLTRTWCLDRIGEGRMAWCDYRDF